MAVEGLTWHHIPAPVGRRETEEGVATITGERGAWFKDSEGNLLALGELQ
jgi:hypothetical protein